MASRTSLFQRFAIAAAAGACDYRNVRIVCVSRSARRAFLRTTGRISCIRRLCPRHRSPRSVCKGGQMQAARGTGVVNHKRHLPLVALPSATTRLPQKHGQDAFPFGTAECGVHGQIRRVSGSIRSCS